VLAVTQLSIEVTEADLEQLSIWQWATVFILVLVSFRWLISTR